jgi:hypothetical protein
MTIVRQRFGKHHLKAGIVEPEQTDFSAVTNINKDTFPLQRENDS